MSLDEMTCVYYLESDEWSPKKVTWEGEDQIQYSEVYYTGILMKTDKTVNVTLEYDGKAWKRVVE